jgi:RNA polymerase sigma-70 factor (ECF subfamily)
MSATVAEPSLEHLLEKLHQGDTTAAEQIFCAYEPYLRTVVRRQLSTKLRSKFDSIDVVQSVWADTLRGFREGAWQFADARRLRAFLVKAARNRFFDRYRQHRQAIRRARPLAEVERQSKPLCSWARPSEEAQAQDLWEQMLTLCPPQHRELLRLKREGLSLAEIACHVNLHPSSVRRILYDLAAKLACCNGSCDARADVGR